MLTPAGVSVCLRYLTDVPAANLFTLSPSSSNPLTVALAALDTYRVTIDRYGYYRMFLKSNILFWRTIGPELWTRLCLIVDSRKNVVQVFSGSKMSIRKMLPLQVSNEQHIWKHVGHPCCCSLTNTDYCAVVLKITPSLSCVSVSNIVHLLFMCVCVCVFSLSGQVSP